MRGGFHKSTMAYVELDGFESDKAFRANFVNGSQLLLNALKTGVGPHKFLWAGPAYNGNPRYAEAIERMHERDTFIEGLRVSRDPCRVCAARGDYACGHRRVA